MMTTLFRSLSLCCISLFSGCVFTDFDASAQVNTYLGLRLPTQTACLSSGTAQLIDFFGRRLPDLSMNCDDTGLPGDVRVAVSGQPKVTLPLYAYGTGPKPITSYGGIQAECAKLKPGFEKCYSTNPLDAPAWLQDSLACGFPAQPALILACSEASCVSEIFDAACASAYPEIEPHAAFKAQTTPWNVGGAVNSGTGISTQDFHAKYEYTGSLFVARAIVQQGRTPVLDMGGMLLDPQGVLKPNARQILSDAIARFPDVFHASNLRIEAVDEPFWDDGNPPSGAGLASQIATLQSEIDLIHALLPNAAIGVTVAPVWDTVPIMVPSIEALLPNLQWLATDVYAQSLDPGAQAHALSLARQFASYMRSHHPSMPIWLIVQGFAPVNEPPPDQWGPDRIATFERFMKSMSKIVASQYSGVLIWGWDFVNELPPQYAGKYFPESIKEFYREATAPPK